MEVGIGHLLAAADVVEDDHPVVVEVNAVYEHVDDAAAESRIFRISVAELPEPGEHFCLGEADLLGDAELGELCFRVGFLCLQRGHAVVDLLPGYLGRFGEGVHQLVQLPVDLLQSLFQVGGAAVGKLPVVLLDNGLCYPFGAGRREHVKHGLLYHVLLDVILALVLLPAGVLFLFIGTRVIMICAAGFRPAALSHHRRAAMPAKGFSLELVVYPGLFGGGRPGDGFQSFLDLGKGLLVNKRLRQAVNKLAVVFILAYIGGTGKRVLKAGVGQFSAAGRSDPPAFEVVDNGFFGDAGGVLREEIADHGRGLVIGYQLSVHDLISVGDLPAQEKALGDILPLAAADVLAEVGGVVFRHGFQQALQDNALGTVGDVLFDGHHADAVLFQTGLVYSAVVAVAGKAVQLPDDHHFKLMLGGVGDHALEVRAGVLGAGEGPVNVLSHHGDALLLGPQMIVTELSFNGLLCLTVGGIAGVNYCVQ